MAQQTHLTIPSGIKSLIDQEGSVPLDLPGGRYYSLNGLGAFIWQQIEAGLAPTDIENAITLKYKSDPKVVHKDVERFVALLAHKMLIIWN